ncbi:MAG: hypothetical protein HXY52_06480 [Nitrospirae bacterium]|jgi:rubrerythrin|nr:hypothetical protein [Nitrospirota bacterium]
MQILNTLDEILKLELKLMDLYAFFSKLFNEDKEAASVFFKLSLDEKGHAELVQYQKRIVSKNLNDFLEVSINIEEIREIISKAENIMKSTVPITLEESIKLALLFEKNAAEYHYKSAVEQSNPEFAKFLNNLASVDNEHFDSIKKLAERKNIKV